MSKGQITLLISAVVLAVLMALLPKVIINKSKKDALAKNEATANRDMAQGGAAEEGHEGHDHAAEGEAPVEAHAAATPAQLKEISDLRLKFSKETNPQAKGKIADELGQKYTAIGKYDSAGYYYEQLAAVRPGEQSYRKAADQYFEAFTFAATQERASMLGQKARGMYEQVLKNNPTNLDAKTNIAMTYISTENPMKGITLLREVITTDPKNEKALFNLGVLSIQSNQYDKAVERFQELVKVNPKHIEGNFYLGVALAETKRKEEALAAFEKVKSLSKNPELLASVDSYIQKLNSGQ